MRSISTSAWAYVEVQASSKEEAFTKAYEVAKATPDDLSWDSDDRRHRETEDITYEPEDKAFDEDEDDEVEEVAE